METKKVNRLWLSWDLMREERWLNEMMMDGWKLAKVSPFSYVFEECEPEQYRFYIETDKPDEDYLEKILANNVEHIGHFGSWNYYAKRTPGYFTDYQRKSFEKGLRDYITDAAKIVMMIIVLLLFGTMNDPNSNGSNLMAGLLVAFAFVCNPGATVPVRRKELLEKDTW